MSTLNAYIWDLDGTLLDSYGSIVSSLAEVAEACGAHDSPDKILRTVKQGSVSGYLRDLAAARGCSYEGLFRAYRQASHGKLEEITLIPGAAETLRVLREKGAAHFVYTHRGASALPLLDRLGIAPFFTETVTHEQGFPLKPSGAGVTYLVEKYALDPARTAYVGDRTLDVLCAKDAGVQAVLYLPEGACVAPTGEEDRIIRNLSDLAEVQGES